MGLKCSVIGHRFEEPGLVHEREPRGDERITVSREVVVCTRCGEQRVLTERKEITKPSSTDVTTATDSDDTRETDDAGESIDTTAIASETAETAAGIAGVDVISDDTESSDAPAPTETTVAPEGTPRARRADNGVILTDDEDGREYGAWPDQSTGTAPETATETEFPGDQQNTHDAQSDTTDPIPADSVHSGPTPTDSQATVDAAIDNGEIIESDAVSRGRATERTEKTLFCQSCSFTVAASESPFRTGDSCPECREAYLTNAE